MSAERSATEGAEGRPSILEAALTQTPRSRVGMMATASAVAFLLGAAAVLNAFGGAAVPVGYLARPLIVVLLMGVAIGVIANLVSRRPGTVTAVALVAMLIVVRPDLVSWPVLVLGGIGLYEAWHRVRRKTEPRVTMDLAGRWARIVTAALFAVAVLQAAIVGQFRVPLPSFAAAANAGPDIYLVLLDGYPRSDTLAEVYGYDNGPFLGALANLGFDVYSEAVSEYDQTSLTLSAILGHQPPTARTDAAGLRARRALMADQRSLEPFREAGYQFVTIPPPVGQAVVDGADRVIDPGHLNDFEAQLLAGSLAGLARDQVLGWLVDAQRQRLDDTLEALVEVGDARGSQVVLAHLMAPNPPFLWTASGADSDGPACWPGCNLWSGSVEELDMEFNAYAAAVRSQVAKVNRLVLDAIGRLVRADPGAVVVVFSDHGSGYDPTADPDEPFRVLFAARTPGQPGLWQSDQRTILIVYYLAGAYAVDELGRQ